MDILTSLQLLSTVPTLKVDGGNWPVFKRKFETYMESAGLEDHFTKSNYPAERYEDIAAKPMKEANETDDDLKKRMGVWNDGEAKWKEDARTWKKEDAKARAALGKVVPDSIYMEISESKTFHKMWDAMEVYIKRISPHQKSNLKYHLD